MCWLQLRRATLVSTAWLVLGFAASSNAQQGATTVQLPTFSFFSVNTTVSVPDSGGGFLGGVSRTQSGSTSRGIPGLGKVPFMGPLARSRGIGSSGSGGTMSVHATIINHEEWDRALLASARRGDYVTREPESIAGEAIGKELIASHRESRDDLAGESVSAIRRRVAIDVAKDPMSDHFAAAATYESQRQWAAAKTEYRLILRDGDEQARKKAAGRLQAILLAERKQPVADRK